MQARQYVAHVAIFDTIPHSLSHSVDQGCKQREQSAFHLFSFLTKQKFFILPNTKLQMAVGMSVCVRVHVNV